MSSSRLRELSGRRLQNDWRRQRKLGILGQENGKCKRRPLSSANFTELRLRTVRLANKGCPA